ncbi:cytohesin-interacting protein-like isoform X2 [Myxocyprinus asiaticus]|uniref:cytohesin-interacting protein-like isoform X2 n=1 Tax=Myxocyprinus asiaticus TaxID=70543 RepID=UPI0022236C30|nr:cytohesin-interacting protein-like isoform X2 [Myxocyprinus asiaticus]
MTSNKNLKAPLKQQRSLDILDGYQKKKSMLWRQCSFNNGKNSNSEETKAGTLSRLSRTHSTSLVDYTDPQRTMIILKKQDNEAFGFEIQTYGLKVKNSSMVEMCTFVCSVQDGSAAEAAGLTTGDIILSVNGVSIEGSTHQHIIELIRESTNMLKLETVSGSVVKRIELEKKMRYLKQTLREKWVELQSLTLQEKRLTRGNLNESTQHLSVDSLMSLSSPTGRSGQRFSSDSSCRSIMTDDSEDGAFTSSVFDDLSPFSPTENAGFFQLESGPSRALTRTSSISFTSSNSSLSPCWDNSSSSVFGTLPRRGRRGSVRKHLLKFIPGLNHSVEEEEAC